ncbi:hypothetical protein FTI75_37985, partial [Burkholderia pseudomallei]
MRSTRARTAAASRRRRSDSIRATDGCDMNDSRVKSPEPVPGRPASGGAGARALARLRALWRVCSR